MLLVRFHPCNNHRISVINDVLTARVSGSVAIHLCGDYVPSENSFTWHTHTEIGSENFEEFLAMLGEKIRLKGWERFRGGLDVKGMLNNWSVLNRHACTRYKRSNFSKTFLSEAQTTGNCVRLFEWCWYFFGEFLLLLCLLILVRNIYNKKFGYFLLVPDRYGVDTIEDICIHNIVQSFFEFHSAGTYLACATLKLNLLLLYFRGYDREIFNLYALRRTRNNVSCFNAITIFPR